MHILFFSVPIILQIICIIHVLKTGRPGWWIFVIIFVPLAGGVAYLIVELIPSLLKSQRPARLHETLIHTLNPGKKIEELEERLEESDTFLNKKELADEYVRQGFYEKAEALYRQCLTGPYTDDIYILHSLAHTLFKLQRYDEAEELLQRIHEKEGRFENHDAWLLYADVLTEKGNYEEAEKEYRVLSTSYPGLKAMFHYGVFLRKNGKTNEASATFRQLLKLYSRLQSFNKRTERVWEQKAREALHDIESGSI
jgi:hypothetical protein